MTGLWCVVINWDEKHSSPPIVPFETYTAAKKFATHMRKRMWAGGYKRRRGQVQVSIMATPAHAEGWNCEW